MIRIVDHSHILRLTLTLTAFTAKVVATASMLEFDFASASDFETLLGSGLGFLLRHENALLLEGIAILRFYAICKSWKTGA
jgi:hypothetical protein